jgi:cytochrome P450
MGTALASIGSQIDLAALWTDPYPIYRELRRHEPVAWVPAANRYLVTRHADIVQLERQPEIFSAIEENSLVTRVMGSTLIRKDGPAHRRERAAAEPAVRPRMLKERWAPDFRRVVNELIDGFIEDGEADLFTRFAAPCAALCLEPLLGIRGVDAPTLCFWSQALIDGSGNYPDDPEVWARADRAAREIDEAVDVAIAHLRDNPDGSIISSMLHADDPLSRDEIRGNVKVIIGGGLNEPRDSIATAVYALLAHPEQRKRVGSDPTLWKAVLEETIRWVAPIGMYPRQTTCSVELGGTKLPKAARLGIVVGSGNRDESVFDDPDLFDIFRAKKPHVAFGGGPHFCLGAWAARIQVGEIALPTLFDRLRGLELSPTEPVRFGGWVFRGPLNLPVRWQTSH